MVFLTGSSWNLFDGVIPSSADGFFSQCCPTMTPTIVTAAMGWGLNMFALGNEVYIVESESYSPQFEIDHRHEQIGGFKTFLFTKAVSLILQRMEPVLRDLAHLPPVCRVVIHSAAAVDTPFLCIPVEVRIPSDADSPSAQFVATCSSIFWNEMWRERHDIFLLTCILLFGKAIIHQNKFILEKTGSLNGLSLDMG